MPLAFRLAYRTLLRHPWRTLATTLGVAIGIAAVLATLSVGENVQANVQSTLVAAAGKADLLVTPGAQGRAVFAIDDIRTIIEKTPGIARIHPVLNYRAEPVRHIQEFEDTVIPGVDTGFQLSGRETSMPADLPTSAKVGHLPARGSMGVAIAEGFAKGRGIEVGDEVPFATTFGDIPFKVTGLLDDSLGLASTNGGRVGLANLHDLQKALRLEGRASYLELILEEGADADKVRTELQDSLGEAYAVTLPAGSGDVTMGVVNTLQAGLRVLAVTLIALGGFMAYNTFAAGVVERRREYALLRTICLTRRQVVRLALAESLAISILGVLVGLALGVGLSVLLTRLNALALGFEFRTLVVPLWTVAVASVVGVAVAMFAGLLPARSASETPPLAAMREPDEPHADRSPPLGWLLLVLGVGSSLAPWPGNWALLGAGLAMVLLFAGIALLGPILLPLALRVLRPALTRLLGTAGKLGAGFTLRNAQRNGVAIGAVIIGMGLTIGVGSMIAGINREISDWVDTTIIGDMFVTSPVSFPAGFEKDVKKRVPDLEAVSGVGLRVVRFQPEGGERGRSVALVLVDPDRFNPDGGFGRFEFIQNQGNAESAYRALKQGGRVLAANTILDRFGIGRGDVARLRTSEGFRDFPVAGVVVDFTGGGEAFVASIEDADLFGGGTPDLFVMTVKPGRDPKEVRQELTAAYPNLYLDVTLNQDYRQRILDLTQRTFRSTDGLLVLAILIAALGVANTLGMNLSSRRHEIAVLRALGLSRRGVATMVGAEGIVIVVVGAVLGVVAGLLLSHVITAGASALTGYRLSPQYPWRLIGLALLSSPLVGLLASLFPARRAARLSPLHALGSAGTP